MRLINGDATDVLRNVPDKSVDLVFTDPPYGHNNNNNDLIHRREVALGIAKKPVQARPIANDGADASDLVRTLFRESARILRCCCCCCCCCCGGGGGPDPQFARWSLWMDEHLRFEQMIVWDKGKMGMGWKYRRSYETVLVGTAGKSARFFDQSRRVENIIRPGDYGIRKRIPKAHDHPTPKPIELPAHFIRLHSLPGELVLDPFMGGGSTAIAAMREGRQFIGIECDGRWFRESIQRVQAELKQPAIREAA